MDANPVIIDYLSHGGVAWVKQEQRLSPFTRGQRWVPGTLVSSDMGPGAVGIVIATRQHGVRGDIEPVVFWTGCPYGEIRPLTLAR